MGCVDKSGYEAKKRWAARNMAEQSAIGMANGLTESQAEALEFLCKARHNFHVDIYALASSDEHSPATIDRLIEACDDMGKVGLPRFSVAGMLEEFASTDYVWYEHLVEYYYDEPEQFEDYSEFFDTDIHRATGELEAVNREVERYLTEIDEKYGTHYCPSGVTRI